MSKTTNKTEKMKIEEKAIDAVAEYLRSLGWNPLVGSFDCIEQGDGKFIFRLVFKFTGKPPKNAKPKINLFP